MTTKLQRQVFEFHRVFDHPVANSPTIPPDDRVRFRLNFVVEEVFEMLKAALDEHTTFTHGDEIVSVFDMLRRAEKAIHDIVDNVPVKVDLPLFVDALADIDYVVEGARLEFGINGEPIADEVHRANLTKVGGERTPEGKTMKPPGWKPPDIAGELERQRRGFGSLVNAVNHNALKEAAKNLPPMTEAQRSEQRLSWCYGQLAIDGKTSRSVFEALAIGGAGTDYKWTKEQFDTWAADKKWDAP